MSFSVGPFAAAPFAGESATAETGTPALMLSLAVAHRAGAPSLALSLVVFAAGAPALALSLTVAHRSGAPALTLRLAVFGAAAPALPLALAVIAAGAYAGAALVWRAVVRLGGADVSARLTGTIEVEAEESAARVASFSIAPVAGAVPVTAWVGKTVEIDFAQQAADGSAVNAVRLFTGVVDVPDYDLASGVTRFTCTDLLQESLDRATREQIDALVGGRWSAAVSGEVATNWDYAQARLASLPSALELDAWRSPRVTPWAAKAAPDVTLSEGDLIDGSAAIRFANRSALRNRRTVSFTYRYPLLQKRGIGRGYKYPFWLGEIVSNGYDIPTREMVRQALDGTGWDVAGEINYDPVPGVPSGVAYGDAAVFTGKVVVPLFGIPVTTDDGKTAFWSVAQDVAEQLCFGYTARLVKRWAQSIDETYTITVSAPASIAQLGTVSDDASAALDNAFDTSAWEAGPAGTSGGNMLDWGLGAADPLPEVVDPGVGHVATEYAGNPAADRAAANAAIETMIAQARTAIIGAHRQHAVEAELAIAPTLDLVHTVRIATPRLTAKGKLRVVRHRMDIESGTAVSGIVVALSRTEAVGVQPDDPIVVPSPPPAETPAFAVGAGAVVSTWIGRSIDTPINLPSNAAGFFTNLANLNSPNYDPTAATYPVQLIVEAPEIEAESRDNKTIEIAASHAVAIPEDELALTIP